MKENLKVLQAFVDSMKANSSLNVKKTIINAYGKQHFIKNALVYAYDPYKKYYVTSKTCKKRDDLCDMNCIHDNAQLIRLPWNKIVNISKLTKLTDDLRKEHGREINLEELKGMVDEDEYHGLFDDYKYKYTVIDIDKPQTANKKTLQEILPSDVTEKAVKKQEFRDEVEALLTDLDPREQEILKMYHGIGYTRSYTLKEIGIDLGLTRERIRQIKEAVFIKIRKKRKYNKL